MRRLVVILSAFMTSRVASTWFLSDCMKSSNSSISSEVTTVLNELISQAKCVYFLHDSSPYSVRVYRSLIHHVPLAYPETPIDMTSCNYLLITVVSLYYLPVLAFDPPPNPKFRILLLTKSSYKTAEAHRKLFPVQRTRFIFITDLQGGVEYRTFLNSNILAKIDRSEVNSIIFETKNTTKYHMAFSGEKFKIITFNNTVYSQISEPDSNGKIGWMTGFELVLLLSLCEWLGLETEVITTTPGVRFDEFYANGSLERPGVETQVLEWEADAVAAGVWLRPRMMKKFEIFYPWEFGCFRYLVPRPKRLVHGWTLYWTFEPLVWVVVFLLDLTVAAVFTALPRISPNPKLKKDSRSFVEWIFKASFILPLMYFPKKSYGCLVPVLAGWVWTCMILVAAFNAELSAILSTPIIDEKIETIPQFLREGFHYGHEPLAKDPVGDEIFFSEQKDDWVEWTFGREWAERTIADRISRMETRKYAVPGESAGKIYYFSEVPIPPYSVIQHYEAASQCYQHFHYSILFPLGSPYAKAINHVMLVSRSAGLLNTWREDVIHSEPVLRQFVAENAFTLTKDTPYKEVPLSIGESAMAFTILLAGHLLATIVFFCEIYLAKGIKWPCIRRRRLQALH